MTEPGPDLTWKEELFRDHILPVLPNERAQYEDLTERQVKRVEGILAQEYVEHGPRAGTFRILALVGIYDLLFLLQPVVYGLLLSVFGSLSLMTPSLHTPSSLADETLGSGDRKTDQIRSEAEQSVRANIGVASLALGFLIQVLAVVGTLGTEILKTNFLQADFPGWVVALVLLWVLGRLDLVGGIPRR